MIPGRELMSSFLSLGIDLTKKSFTQVSIDEANIFNIDPEVKEEAPDIYSEDEDILDDFWETEMEFKEEEAVEYNVYISLAPFFFKKNLLWAYKTLLIIYRQRSKLMSKALMSQTSCLVDYH